ncbi:hypothetical protein [uncultured Sphingomonas sp.]|uniref:hypothetical protein n=1 Tax=uncultured Sphingomonas sp. TaxID=158754 RepID=UPI00260488D8|nr:hypothetical protein [uncultured Sphingomonas sp.]
MPAALRIAMLATLASTAMPAGAEEAAQPDFFGGAICQPPYSIDGATALYHAAEKLGKADTSGLGGAVYHLPAPITRDGFTTQDVLFAGSAYGVLIAGEVAAKLAETYHLSPETTHLLGASSLGFARALPDAEQPMKGTGLVSIVARQGPGLKGRTMLACEFVSNEDRERLEMFEKAQNRQR